MAKQKTKYPKSINVGLTAEQYTAVTDIAETEDRTPASVLRIALRYWLAQRES